MKNNLYVNEGSKRIYKIDYNFILENKCNMLFLVHKT